MRYMILAKLHRILILKLCVLRRVALDPKVWFFVCSLSVLILQNPKYRASWGKTKWHGVGGHGNRVPVLCGFTVLNKNRGKEWWQGIRVDTIFGGTRYLRGHGIWGDTVFGGFYSICRLVVCTCSFIIKAFHLTRLFYCVTPKCGLENNDSLHI